MDGYMSEIRLFGGTFAPQGYMLCQGQQMSIAEWTALYALLGTMYGGDGVQSFSLPDLRGRTPMGTGQGPGLSVIVDEGETGGTETITMSTSNMPIHNHSASITALNASATLKAFTTAGSTDQPIGSYLASTADLYIAPASADTFMAPQSVSGTLSLSLSATGSNTPFSNRSPFLGINFIICVEGIFPSRN
ncbi:MAG: phage tail protein [Bacteroidia bacterium]|jgi:microcystin-dependent protein|nr:phage tail protein [Bacteroidia bacterium]MBP7261743.1 phage tail protein [Bacteroidia bacterium]MBP9180133.1 phage tail protein [Bacteroidia bacterium]MBP9725292.1 phage tail protein [Bacteroidia bacterium]